MTANYENRKKRKKKALLGGGTLTSTIEQKPAPEALYQMEASQPDDRWSRASVGDVSGSRLSTAPTNGRPVGHWGQGWRWYPPLPQTNATPPPYIIWSHPGGDIIR